MRHPQREPFANGTHATSGYSLTELAFVLVIIGLVGGMSLSVGKIQMDVAEFRGTSERLKTVRGALQLFQMKYKRYPCPSLPADNPGSATYGIEAAGGCAAACPAELTCDNSAVIGAVPFKTLRLNEESAYDSWDNKITYVVDKGHTEHSGTNAGGIPIVDINGNEITSSPILGDAIFVLVSHGRDGKGAYSKAGTLVTPCGATGKDIGNCNGDDIFVDSRFSLSDTAANYYDDLVAWKTQENYSEEDDNNTDRALMTTWGGAFIISGGKVFGTGSDGYGKLGNGPIGNTTSFGEIVGGFSDWIRVGGDNEVNCALRRGGQAYCWGYNSNGQLGDGTTTNRDVPTQVGVYTDWISIDVDMFHACGIRSNGRAYCWGLNDKGQVGDGTTTNHHTPTEVAGGFTDWSMITVTSTATCALRSGRAYCWGNNAAGNLGNGTWVDASVPTEVAGGHTDWIFIESDTTTQTCGIRSPGIAYCWGVGGVGQLGDGTYTAQVSTPVAVSGGFTDWITLSTSSAGQVACGVRANGLAYCWGGNVEGELGQSISSAGYTTPQLVSGGFTDWRLIDASGRYGCGARANGKLYCWGTNASGEFGNGTTSGTVVGPMEILGITVDLE